MSDLSDAFHHSDPRDVGRASTRPTRQSVTASTRACDTCPRYTDVMAAGFESDLADCQSFGPSIPAARRNLPIIRTAVLRYAGGSAPFCRRVEGS